MPLRRFHAASHASSPAIDFPSYAFFATPFSYAIDAISSLWLTPYFSPFRHAFADAIDMSRFYWATRLMPFTLRLTLPLFITCRLSFSLHHFSAGIGFDASSISLLSPFLLINISFDWYHWLCRYWCHIDIITSLFSFAIYIFHCWCHLFTLHASFSCRCYYFFPLLSCRRYFITAFSSLITLSLFIISMPLLHFFLICYYLLLLPFHLSLLFSLLSLLLFHLSISHYHYFFITFLFDAMPPCHIIDISRHFMFWYFHYVISAIIISRHLSLRYAFIIRRFINIDYFVLPRHFFIIFHHRLMLMSLFADFLMLAGLRHFRHFHY